MLSANLVILGGGRMRQLKITPRKDGDNVAKTKKGKKIVETRTHYRKLKNGRRVRVNEHRRSTPN